MTHIILGIQVEDRVANSNNVQKLLTEYGCYIKSRIGLHDVHVDHCSPTGIIILEMFGEDKFVEEFKLKIKNISGVNLQEMRFK